MGVFIGKSKYHDAEMKFKAIIYDGTCIILPGRQKFQRET